ncbi:MAG: anthranilate phosphoribosyltransferase [Campylobacterales bacterium]|nr:anthranilate phosphoribosyltransferase [Campylobacterales bacterium]
MTYTEAKDIFEKLFTGQLSEDEGKDLLVSLYERGETVEEIQAAVETMRAHSIKLDVDNSIKDKLFDNCGTGGDKSGSFNISTTVSFILAAAGLYVAKHGNRSITSKSGSADMLEALGMNLDLSLEQQSKLLEETGFAFLFAQKHHPAMRFVMPLRKSLSHRTIFNIMGPLTNPADIKKQFIGVFDKSYTKTMAEVLKATGSTDAMVVSSNDGLDEISLSDITYASILSNGVIGNFEIDPEEYGFRRSSLEAIKGGEAKENAGITQSILNGSIKNEKRDIVLINSAGSLITSGIARDFREGIEIAKEMINSKKAIEILKKVIEVSNKL